MKNNCRRICSVLFLAAAAGLLLEACTTVPVTGRRELNFISADQEMQLGLSSFDQLKTNTPVSHDPALNAQVQRVGRRIAAVAGKDLPNAQWEFVVFDSPEANAFCLPGGKVGVYTGILPVTKDDAGLATVLGHEIGHAVAHHGASRMSQAQLTQAGGQLLGSSLSTSDPQVQTLAMAAYGVGAKVGLELPYDRKQESEADHIGLIYMAQAGYDPKAAIAFWERFAQYNQQHGGQGGMAFLRTHPLDSVRIAQLQSWLPEAGAAFKPSPAR
jgi:metalloendopeptidase OMA1, mitochondrial